MRTAIIVAAAVVQHHMNIVPLIDDMPDLTLVPSESTARPSRVAIYDISAHTVILPDGTRLEAHSGIGHRQDNPHFTRAKNRGPTPPNVYRLSLRERRFYGVRAIRLNPENEDLMHGRDGMLAHSYLHGDDGQSNGCVAIRHYDRFLDAFLDGDFDRLVVIPSAKAVDRLSEFFRAFFGIPIDFLNVLFDQKRGKQ